MASNRYIGLVAVGVNRTKLLTELKGAASGAERLSKWLEDQCEFGVESVSKVLTDTDDKTVSARQVQDATRELIEDGGLDLLVLYFSGHGIVKSGGDEQVLLSEVKVYPDEAINIAATASNARHIAIPHVVIISDACRSSIDPFGPLGQVTGKPAVLRGKVVGIRPGKVDVFYATEPSQTAKEYKGDGFFTTVLLEALIKCPEEICENWAENQKSIITTWRLEDYLYNQIPIRAQQQTPSFDQTPDIIVTARKPLFFGYGHPQRKKITAPAIITTKPTRDYGFGSQRGGPLAHGPGGGDEKMSYGGGEQESHEHDFGFTAKKNRSSSISPKSSPARERQRALDEISGKMNEGEGGFVPEHLLTEAGLIDYIKGYVGTEAARDHFETGTGYSIVGAAVEEVLVAPDKHADLFYEKGNGRTDIRMQGDINPGTSSSILVLFETKTMCVLPLMPGYIGTIQVTNGLVRSVSLDLNEQDRSRLGEGTEDRVRFEQRRAIAAAFASAGKLRKLAGEDAKRFAMAVRGNKRIDPCLGIYAAYAYALAGEEECAQSIYSYFKAYQCDSHLSLRPAPVPFDVAMLACALANTKNTPIAPFCPMMSLGWSLLESYLDELDLHPAVLTAGRRRLNAEWTTFATENAKDLIEAFTTGGLL